MKKIALGILADNLEENVVFMTTDGQGFFDPIKANNHAKKNEFKVPEAFYRGGFEPEDTLALDEQLGFAQEENETLTSIVDQVAQVVDFTKEAPEVTQESNEVVAAVVQLREKHQGAIDLIDNVIVALVANEIVVDEKAEPVVIEIMKLRVSLKSVTAEKETLATSLKNLQAELDTLKAATVDVVVENVKKTTPIIAPKKAK